MKVSHNKSHYNDCRRKTRYNDEHEAEKYGKRYGLRVYYCEHCNGFHLSSRPDYYEDKEEEDGCI